MSPTQRSSRRLSGRPLILVCLLAASSALLAGCATAAADSRPAKTPAASQADLSGSLRIFAAASLTDAFDELAQKFSEKHPAVKVRPIDYDGSSVLATQLIEGAPADVFASANMVNIDKVADAGLLQGKPEVFTSNVLEIAVAPGNPKHISSLADLARKDLTVVLCAPEVPCGSASHKLLDADGVTVTPASEEQNVTAVVTKVGLGEADAGLVYVTDIAANDDKVDGVKIDGADRATNRYGIGVLKDAPNPEAGRAFVAWVLSKEGQSVLASYGFASK